MPCRKGLRQWLFSSANRNSPHLCRGLPATRNTEWLHVKSANISITPEQLAITPNYMLYNSHILYKCRSLPKAQTRHTRSIKGTNPGLNKPQICQPSYVLARRIGAGKNEGRSTRYLVLSVLTHSCFKHYNLTSMSFNENWKLRTIFNVRVVSFGERLPLWPAHSRLRPAPCTVHM